MKHPAFRVTVDRRRGIEIDFHKRIKSESLKKFLKLASAFLLGSYLTWKFMLPLLRAKGWLP